MQRIIRSEHFAVEESFRQFSRKYSQRDKLKQVAKLPVAESAALGIDVYYQYKPFQEGVTCSEEIEMPISADLGGGLNSKTYAPIKERIQETIGISPSSYKVKEKDFCNYSCVTPDHEDIGILEWYLEERGILSHATRYNADFNRGETPDNGIYFGNGSNELFNVAVSYINQDLDKIVTGKDVVLYQVPCYAYFSDSTVYNQCDVETIPMLEENGFKLTPDQLRTKIINVNQKLFSQHIEETLERYPAYFRKLKTSGIAVEKLPKMMVYSPELTPTQFAAYRNQLIAAIQEQCPDLEQREKIPEPPRPAQVSTLVFNNPHSPLGTYYTQSEIDELQKVRSEFELWVIEDRANEELNVVPVAPLGSFGRVPKGSPQRVFILLTPSKNLCLADLRLGFICAFTKETPILSPGRMSIFRAMNLQVGTVGRFKSSLLVTAFGTGVERETFIKELTQEYAWRQNLALQLIGGRKLLGAEEKEDKLNEYEAYIQRAIPVPEVYKMLTKGVPGLKLVRKPEFAFQLLLDLTAFKGMYMGLHQLNTPLDFRMALFKQANICTISEILYPEKAFIRYSLGVERMDIVLSFVKFHLFFSLLQPKPLSEVVTCYRELDALQAQDSCVPTAPALSSGRILDRLIIASKSPSAETKDEQKAVTGASDATAVTAVYPPVLKSAPAPLADAVKAKQARIERELQIQSQITDHYILPKYHITYSTG